MIYDWNVSNSSLGNIDPLKRPGATKDNRGNRQQAAAVAAQIERPRREASEDAIGKEARERQEEKDRQEQITRRAEADRILRG